MNEPIISRDTIRARARRAFEASRTRDDHNMNPGAAALVDWLAEYDRLAAQQVSDGICVLRRIVARTGVTA